jgi:ATP-dependent protease ClpP protease subunit
MTKESLSNWLTLEMAADKTATINISGHIGIPESWQNDPEQAEAVVSTKEKMNTELEKIANLKADIINVNVDSFGGDVNHGLSIFNALVQNKAKVVVNYTGWSASIATVIAAAGDEVNAPNNWMGLIHEGRGPAGGTVSEIRAKAEHIEKANNIVANIYANKGGQEAKVYREIMAEENGEGTWHTATELQEIGLIDNVIEPMAIAANYESRAKEFGINSNIDMSIFNKKKDNKQVNLIELGEVKAVYDGELQAGVQLVGVGADVIDGTYEVEGNSVEVKDSTVASVEPKEVEMVAQSDVEAIVAKATEDLTAERDQLKADLEAKNAELVTMTENRDNLAKLKSGHKPETKEGVENVGEIDIDAAIRNVVKDHKKEVAKKKEGAK